MLKKSAIEQNEIVKIGKVTKDTLGYLSYQSTETFRPQHHYSMPIILPTPPPRDRDK